MLLRNFTMSYPEKVDEVACHRYISKVVGAEYSRLTKPCYYPKLTIYFQDIQEITGFTNEHIETFKKGILDPYSKYVIYNDKYTVLILMCILYFFVVKKLDTAKLFYQFLAIKFYSSRFHIHFKFCKDDLFVMALEQLSHKHLFKVKGGVGSAIDYIYRTEYEKYQYTLSKPVKNISDKELVAMVYSLRTRIAQSVRSFAEVYYKIFEKGEGIKKTKEEEEEGESGSALAADKYSMIICTYGQIDKLALGQAISQSGIMKGPAVSIVTQFSTSENREKLRFIITLITRIEKITNICTETGRNRIIRKIISDVKFNNYSVKEEIKDLIYSLDSGYQFRTLHVPQLVMFFCHYLTLFLKYRIC
jgi:hypothetical protein